MNLNIVCRIDTEHGEFQRPVRMPFVPFPGLMLDPGDGVYYEVEQVFHTNTDSFVGETLVYLKADFVGDSSLERWIDDGWTMYRPAIAPLPFVICAGDEK